MMMIATKTTKIPKIPKTRREREVWGACDELWEELCEEGLPISKLTGEKLKNKLVSLGYKKGDQGQIYKYRNSWQLSKGIEENEDLVLEERRSFLSEKVQKSVEILFKEIQSEADDKISKLKNESESKVKEFGNKYEAIKKEKEILRNKLDEISQEAYVMKQTNSELSSQLVKERHEHEVTKERLNGVETKVAQLSIESEKRERLLNERNEKDKKESQNKIDDLIDAHNEDLSTLKEHSENQRHQHIVEIENLKLSNSKLDKQLGRITLMEQKANNISNELKQRIKNLENELTHSNSDHKKLIKKSHETEKELAENKGEFKQLHILLKNQKEDYKNSNKQLLDYKERVGRLEEQLQQAKRMVKEKQEKLEVNKKKASKK